MDTATRHARNRELTTGDWTGDSLKSAAIQKKHDATMDKAPRQTTAYRKMLKDRVTCPQCHREMTIRSLQYKHTCKQEKPPEQVQKMRTKATEAAVAAHARRMERLKAG